MGKYINADDAIERLIVHHALIKEERNADYEHTDTYNGMLLGIKDAQKIITDMPAADVVEVVRCKDCSNYMTILRGKCKILDEYRNPDDYCSYAERRESE